MLNSPLYQTEAVVMDVRWKSYTLYSVLILTGLFIYSVLMVSYLRSEINQINTNSPCDEGWQPYKHEKCLKLFHTAGLLGYANAENFCNEQNGSFLLSIDVGEKQECVKRFLKSMSVVDNVWIGLKYENDSFRWTDGTRPHYTNWARGSPKKNASYCVQIQMEAAHFGLWSDELCEKKNMVVCEKNQHWDWTRMQTIVMNAMRNPIVPIGFIYVQLPEEKSPVETWPWMEWKDVSSEYAGLFFRTEGGNAAPFGQKQNADSPRLISLKKDKADDESHWSFHRQTANEINVLANNEYSRILDIDGSDSDTKWGFRVKVSNREVRPENMAIRIWKRIA